ncbi:LysR family transcriptional regulator [Sporomusa sp.]|uniref:LysR family transcriptional regulator n=1 Tax=Sporomusa sp. TaxID=2078658 RepID=UPI002C094A95|nr:LysR family transcriptional regulator [Sporomusa sp.]HWR10148.1 LysR family transcriptional regulator [Sporomusa sp.]
MELYQLKTFVEIARRGNLTEASLHLHTSQPAASAHIKALEEEVGFTLFHRNPKGMTITEKGSKLLTEAQRILDTLDVFYDRANELQANPTRTLRIGLNTDGEVLQIQKLIKLASKSLPQLELHFVQTRSEDISNDLASSKIDAGFYYGKHLLPAVQTIKLHSFSMVLVYPSEWDIDTNDLSLKYFEKTPWIWTTKGCPFYKEAAEFFQKNNITPCKIVYVDDETLIGKLVQAEIGCSLLAEPVAKQFAKEKILKIWQGIDLNIDLNFGYPKGSKNDPELLEICSILNSMWKAS